MMHKSKRGGDRQLRVKLIPPTPEQDAYLRHLIEWQKNSEENARRLAVFLPAGGPYPGMIGGEREI